MPVHFLEVDTLLDARIFGALTLVGYPWGQQPIPLWDEPDMSAARNGEFWRAKRSGHLTRQVVDSLNFG